MSEDILRRCTCGNLYGPGTAGYSLDLPPQYEPEQGEMKKIKNTGPIHRRVDPDDVGRAIGADMDQAAIDKQMRRDLANWPGNGRYNDCIEDAYEAGWRAGYEAGRE